MILENHVFFQVCLLLTVVLVDMFYAEAIPCFFFFPLLSLICLFFNGEKMLFEVNINLRFLLAYTP